jgi:hypothetical protein
MWMMPVLAMMGSPPTPVETGVWLTLFAAQTEPFKPQKTHTFATITRITPTGPVSQTISWLPRTQHVRGLAIRPEAGFNLTLCESLAWARRGGMCVSVWGPYPVDACLEHRFACRIAELQSGRIRYKALDALPPRWHASNCVHAVTGVITAWQRPVGAFGYGDVATRETLDFFAPSIRDWTPKTDLLATIGVDPRTVQMRSVAERPTRGESLKSFFP